MKKHMQNVVSCSWHQPPPNHEYYFPQFFPQIFLSLSRWKRKETCFRPMKSLLSFSTAQTEKNSWKKSGKTRFVVWWFDVTNKIKKGKSWMFGFVVSENLDCWIRWAIKKHDCSVIFLISLIMLTQVYFRVLVRH